MAVPWSRGIRMAREGRTTAAVATI